MAPDGFEEFFLATAGAGGAFVGLLFVAISISPQRTFGDLTAVGAPRQHLAEGTFLTLVNGFIMSSIALIPSVNVGWVALVLGGAGVLTAAHLGWLFARLHSHEVTFPAGLQHRLRTVSLSLVATVAYAIECLLGLRLILQSTDEEAFGWLAVIIISLYALGIFRAWTLLGDPRYGWSSWLNPLQDGTTTREVVSGDTTEPQDAAVPPYGDGTADLRRRERHSPW